MQEERKGYHILGTSANLLGICLVIITGLKISNLHTKTLADEICFADSFLLLVSCFLSYLSIRAGLRSGRYEALADKCFLAGITGIFAAMVVLFKDFQ